jgi:hypothetical protein
MTEAKLKDRLYIINTSSDGPLMDYIVAQAIAL